ncbi:MAG: hypothetical protein JXA77_16815 [Bacteroidales bacterium]|nr:hypothetical protein [Bacteroidales bacterium]MBN2819363.1 hypothetical protein [Bacteroidales bacterium]
MLVYNSENSCIIHIEKKMSLYLAIEGYMESLKIKEFAKALVEFCLTKKIKHIFFDTSKISVVKHEDLFWVTENVFPKLQDSEIEKVAFLLPAKSFGYMAVKILADRIEKKQNKVFARLEEAEKWLYGSI